MPVLDVLYKLGDRMVGWMTAQGVSEEDVSAWKGYWTALATEAITAPREKHDALAGRMAAALQIAVLRQPRTVV